MEPLAKPGAGWPVGCKRAGVVLLVVGLTAAVLAPGVLAERARYVAPSQAAVCAGRGTCSEAGVGLVVFEVPGDASTVEITLEDATDGQGFDQPGQYNFEDDTGSEILDADVRFCDAATPSVPSNAATLKVEVYNGASHRTPFFTSPCEGQALGTTGEVGASFR